MRGTVLLNTLKRIAGPSRIKLSPGPFIAIADQRDAVAAKLIGWLVNRLPEDATYGDAEDVLLSSLWCLEYVNMLQPGGPTPIGPHGAVAVDLATGQGAAVAAELIKWLVNCLPEDATYSDAEHILLSALWWTLFLNMQPRCSPGAVRRAGRRRNHREIPRSPA